DVGVLLAGDFFRHLEDHLDQGVHRKLLRAEEQHATLADVLDDAFIPRAGAIDAVAQGNVEFEPARPGHPGGALLARMAATHPADWLMLHALGTAHGGPVVLVFGGAQQANLIVVAVGTAAGPGELVGAAS